MEQGLRQGCVLAPLLFNILFAAAINEAYTRYKVDTDIMDCYRGPGEWPRVNTLVLVSGGWPDVNTLAAVP